MVALFCMGDEMRALIAAALLMALAGGAVAEEWRYEGGSVPIAWVDTGAAQFQFACRGGDLAMAFWVRKPHKQVASAGSMNLAITPDGSDTSYAQDMPLIHSDGSSAVVRGPVARQWARIAQQARSSIKVAYVRAGGETFDTTEFGAKGSLGAIRRVLENCG